MGGTLPGCALQKLIRKKKDTKKQSKKEKIARVIAKNNSDSGRFWLKMVTELSCDITSQAYVSQEQIVNI